MSHPRHPDTQVVAPGETGAGWAPGRRTFQLWFAILLLFALLLFALGHLVRSARADQLATPTTVSVTIGMDGVVNVNQLEHPKRAMIRLPDHSPESKLPRHRSHRGSPRR